MEAAVDMVYPAPCWPWVPLVKEDQQLGLLWLPGAVNDRWFLEVCKPRAGFACWPRGPVLAELLSCLAVHLPVTAQPCLALLPH